MTAVLARPETPAGTTTLRALAGVEARRYARHPLFLLGLVPLVVATIATSDDLTATGGDASIVPAFFLGVLGVGVGYQLTRSMARTSEAVGATPVDGVLRTAALCLACLVSGLVALVWLAAMLVALRAEGLPTSTISGSDRAALLLACVVAAVGGPLVGVLVGRWTRFPGAGLVTVVLLVGWTLLGTVAVGDASPNRLTSVLHLNAPFAFWISADSGDSPLWVAGGSPWWYLVYLTVLCGLAATAAMLREAAGVQRTRLWRVLAVLGGLALSCLALAVAADPARVFL
jgi:hypothetical protein